MAVVANRAPSNPAFWLVAPIPEGFAVRGDSSAPLSGDVALPVHLWWSGDGSDSLDMADPDTRAFVYERVLTNGTAEDVVEWVNPDSLVEAWERMYITVPVAEVWQPWIDAQCR